MAMSVPMPADILVTYTLFEDRFAQKKTERSDQAWSDLVAKIRSAPTYLEKNACPLISMAEYGDLRSPNNAFRHAANVLRVYGIELDYDAGDVSIEIARQRLEAASLMAVLYTSPSHKPSAPRWRALLPLAEPASPDRRQEYVARANRALGGIVTRESFTLSQSFYIGRVRGADYVVEESPGRTIDQAMDLEPLFHIDSRNDGKTARDVTTDAQLREAFKNGADRYQTMLKFSARWAARGMAADDIEANLVEMLGSSPHNGDGIDLTTRARPLAESAVRKFGETRRPMREEAPPEYDSPPPEAFLEHFEPVTEPDAKPIQSSADIKARAWVPVFETDIAPRAWLYGYHYMRGMVSMTAAPGGVGKSTTVLVELISMAIGRDLLNNDTPLTVGRLKVWYHNGEDPFDEIQRRIVAICKHYRVEQSELVDHLYVTSGRDTRLIVAEESRDGLILVPVTKERVLAEVRELGISVISLDPFVSTHRVRENDNTAMEEVMAIWRDIAEQGQLAVEIVHHFRKATPGSEPTADDVRGASSLTGACRSVRIVTAMTRDEAEKFGIEDGQHRRYVWIGNPKANMVPPVEKRVWRFLESVQLNNAREPYRADEVGVATAWSPPEAEQLMRFEQKLAVLADIGSMTSTDQFSVAANSRSSKWVGNLIAKRCQLDIKDRTVRADITRAVQSWIAAGEIETYRAYSPAEGRSLELVRCVKGS